MFENTLFFSKQMFKGTFKMCFAILLSTLFWFDGWKREIAGQAGGRQALERSPPPPPMVQITQVAVVAACDLHTSGATFAVGYVESVQCQLQNKKVRSAVSCCAISWWW